MQEKKLRVITYRTSEYVTKLDIVTIDHGSELHDVNPIAVVEGEVHKPADCLWCSSLRKRCQNRRLM